MNPCRLSFATSPSSGIPVFIPSVGTCRIYVQDIFFVREKESKMVLTDYYRFHDGIYTYFTQHTYDYVPFVRKMPVTPSSPPTGQGPERQRSCLNGQPSPAALAAALAAAAPVLSPALTPLCPTRT